MHTFCRYIALIILLCGMVLPLSAQQRDGLSCENPIRVDSTYTGTFDAGSYYFTAWTYDLPLTVYVFPASGVKGAKPQLLADFTCTPGVYDDPDIDRMAHGVNDFGISLPFNMEFEEDIINGKFAWHVDFPVEMKYALALFSVTKDIQAIVKLTIYERSTATLTPTIDPCDSISEIAVPYVFDNMLLDTTQIYKFPIGELAHGNVRVRWTGQDTAVVYVGTDCMFPLNPFDSRFYDYMYLSSDRGDDEDSYLFVSKNMLRMAANENIFNLYFRFLGGAEGMIIFEDAGDAKRLHLDTPQPINANDQSTVYSIPVSWKDMPLRFHSIQPNTVTMFISTEPFFSPNDSAKGVIGSYQFVSEESGGRELCLSSVEMATLTNQTKDSLLYVKFITPTATTITPSVWVSSVCAVKTVELYWNETYTIPKTNTTTYRAPLSTWGSGDITFYMGKGTEDMYIWWADTCAFPYRRKNIHVLQVDTIHPQDSVTIKQEVLSSFAADADNYVYFRLRSSAAGEVTITSSAPDIPNPTPTYQNATIFVQCDESGEKLLISVSQEQNLQLLDEQGNIIKSWSQKPGNVFSVHTFVDCLVISEENDVIKIQQKTKEYGKE